MRVNSTTTTTTTEGIVLVVYTVPVDYIVLVGNIV